MNQYGAQLQEQWEALDPNRAAAMGAEYFTAQGEVAQAQIEALTLQLVGSDLPNETYMEKVGRIANAKTRAAEMVMADLLRPVDQSEWDHRFWIWQGSHPLRVTLNDFYREMDEIEDRTIESPEDELTQTRDAELAKATAREALAALGLASDLIDRSMEPTPVDPKDFALPNGEPLMIWTTPEPEVGQAIVTIARQQWEALPLEVRETAWDAPSDGADYYQATQRAAKGLPRF